jgi:transcriptional regulator with XRE-family HTH domain
MIKGKTRRGDLDSKMGLTRSGPREFNTWLQLQLKARKLTQRQLAQKSGVDHSTISRLIRGDRVPSLRTAALLARCLEMPQEMDDQGFDISRSRTARVEYALRSDDLLNEAQVREIMNVYLAARLRRPRIVVTQAPVETARSTPVPIVTEIPGLPPRSTSIGRRPTAVRGRSS